MGNPSSVRIPWILNPWGMLNPKICLIGHREPTDSLGFFSSLTFLFSQSSLLCLDSLGSLDSVDSLNPWVPWILWIPQISWLPSVSIAPWHLQAHSLRYSLWILLQVNSRRFSWILLDFDCLRVWIFGFRIPEEFRIHGNRTGLSI